LIILKNINLLLRFLLEITVLVSVGYWSFNLYVNWIMKIIICLFTIVVISTVWGSFIAPNSSHQIKMPYRLLVELLIFGIGVGAFYFAGRIRWSILFAGLVLVNLFFLFLWKQ